MKPRLLLVVPLTVTVLWVAGCSTSTTSFPKEAPSGASGPPTTRAVNDVLLSSQPTPQTVDALLDALERGWDSYTAVSRTADTVIYDVKTGEVTVRWTVTKQGDSWIATNKPVTLRTE